MWPNRIFARTSVRAETDRAHDQTTLQTTETSHQQQSLTMARCNSLGAIAEPAEDRALAAVKLAVLTHYLPPYTARVLQHIAVQVPQTRVMLSVPLEPNRSYALDWGGLDVEVQNNLMLRRLWKHQAGFEDELYVHVPHDTLRRLRRFRPDIVFSFELGFRSLASAIYRRFNPRVRLAFCVCVSEHTEYGRGSARWLLRRLLVRMADAITFNGPSCERYLKRLGVPSEKLYHFPYAADDRTAPQFGTTRDSEPNRRLLVVGQLSQRKGVLPLLDGLSAYCRKHPDQAWDLTFVGTGPLEQAIRTREYPANLRVNLRGHIAPEDLASQWLHYGVLVFPTLADEWGLVVNEAMRAGLPVIGSRYAQASTTLIEEGYNGWLYSPDRPLELEAKLARLSRLSASELAAMREQARSSVAHITSRAAAERACAMFRQLLVTA